MAAFRNDRGANHQADWRVRVHFRRLYGLFARTAMASVRRRDLRRRTNRNASADYLLSNFNTTGAILVTASTLMFSLYLVSSFSMTKLASWLSGPIAFFKRLRNKYESWRDIRRQKHGNACALAGRASAPPSSGEQGPPHAPSPPLPRRKNSLFQPSTASRAVVRSRAGAVSPIDTPPWDEEIPIRTLEEDKGSCADKSFPHEPEPVVVPPAPDPEPAPVAPARASTKSSFLPIAALRRRCSTSRRAG